MRYVRQVCRPIPHHQGNSQERTQTKYLGLSLLMIHMHLRAWQLLVARRLACRGILHSTAPCQASVLDHRGDSFTPRNFAWMIHMHLRAWQVLVARRLACRGILHSTAPCQASVLDHRGDSFTPRNFAQFLITMSDTPRRGVFPWASTFSWGSPVVGAQENQV